MNRLFIKPVLRRRLQVWSFLCVVMLAGCKPDLLKNAADFKADVTHALDARDFSIAAAAAQRFVEKAPEDYEAYFLLAQARAEAGDRNGAIVALEQAIKKGLRDDTAIDQNAHLQGIRSMTAYADLMKSSFPSRHAAPDVTASGIAAGAGNSGSVSITETNGKQVLRAGDVVIEIPANK